MQWTVGPYTVRGLTVPIIWRFQSFPSPPGFLPLFMHRSQLFQAIFSEKKYSHINASRALNLQTAPGTHILHF